MDWSSITPAAITGIVGLAGIIASIASARLTSRSASNDLQLSIKAEDDRNHTSEKRRIYVDFNEAIASLHIVATSSEDFTVDPGRQHYNQALSTLWSRYYGVSLVSPAKVHELARTVTDAMNEMAYNLRTRRS